MTLQRGSGHAPKEDDTVPVCACGGRRMIECGGLRVSLAEGVAVGDVALVATLCLERRELGEDQLQLWLRERGRCRGGRERGMERERE
eukprot:2903544-Rhodomonas_salina.1